MGQKVPARPEGQPTVREIAIQKDLASRTLERLAPLMRDGEREAALGCLREAFREAHCDATIYNAYFWDLGGNSRVRAQTSENEAVSIPSTELPAIGTILDWNGKTYYVASHRA